MCAAHGVYTLLIMFVLFFFSIFFCRGSRARVRTTPKGKFLNEHHFHIHFSFSCTHTQLSTIVCALHIVLHSLENCMNSCVHSSVSHLQMLHMLIEKVCNVDLMFGFIQCQQYGSHFASSFGSVCLTSLQKKRN